MRPPELPPPRSIRHIYAAPRIVSLHLHRFTNQLSTHSDTHTILLKAVDPFTGFRFCLLSLLNTHPTLMRVHIVKTCSHETIVAIIILLPIFCICNILVDFRCSVCLLLLHSPFLNKSLLLCLVAACLPRSSSSCP